MQVYARRGKSAIDVPGTLSVASEHFVFPPDDPERPNTNGDGCCGNSVRVHVTPRRSGRASKNCPQEELPQWAMGANERAASTTWQVRLVDKLDW